MRFFNYRCLAILFLTIITQVAFGQVANFTTSTPSGCSPIIVNFTSTSTGASSYLWNFGNGNTSPVANPSATFPTPGNYTVTLTINGGVSTKSTTITVYPKPIPNFTASSASAAAGQSIVFTNSSTTGGSTTITSYQWDFGDGSPSSTTTNPSHVYSTPGNRSVSLTVTNSSGCISSTNKMIIITAPVGIEEKDETNFFSIYPNPSTDFITVTQSNNLNDSQIQVFDLNGKLINSIALKAGETSIKMDVSNYPKGNYVMRLVSEKNENVATKNMIVN
jgi:PKD repeat protein